MDKNKKRDLWIVAISIAIFIFWKLSTVVFRFGDENVYFYMASAILHGLVPYKDFVFADPPFFIYLLTLFKALFGSHLILLKTLPILFDSLSALMIYLLLRNKNKFAFLGPIFYLFSFTVLSTSDYVTGAEVMIFLVLSALWLDQREKYFYSGIFWALACLCKLYAGPALLGFLFYKLISKEYLPVKKIILGGLAATVLVMTPFIILAPHQTLSDLIIFQLHRPHGINKWNIFGVFLGFEWLLVAASVAGIFIRRNIKYLYPLIFSAVFFLIFRDLYYLYLHILLPFMILLAVQLVEFLNEKKEELAWGFMIIYFCIIIYSILGYVNVYQPQGIFNNPEEIAQALKTAPDNSPVYGAQEVAPLIALLSDKIIFNNIIDTNTQNFGSGAQNLDLVSKSAVQNGIYLVARVANYPEQKIQDTGFEGYFDRKMFDASCKLFKSFDRPTPGDPLNQVAIYKCIRYTP